MPNIKSAKKRLRQTPGRTLQNASRRTLIRTTRRKFIDAVQAGDEGSTHDAFSNYCSALDKAVKHNIIKKNNAIRKKKRAAKLMTSSSEA